MLEDKYTQHLTDPVLMTGLVHTRACTSQRPRRVCTKEPTRSSGTAASPALTCSIGRRSRPYATVGTARPVPIPPCLGPGQSESEIPQFLATLMGLSGGRGPLFTVRYYKYLAPGGAIFGPRERALLHSDGGALDAVSGQTIG